MFEPVPKSPKLRRQPGVRPIGMRMPEGAWFNTHAEIREAIENKAKKYGQFHLPFVVAVNFVGEHCDNIDVMNALFGQDSIVVTQARDGSLSERNQRKPNGAWRGPKGPRGMTVSAILMFVQLNPWSMGKTTPELFHNPWAQNPLLTTTLPFPYCLTDIPERRVRHESGISPRDILALPEEWPLLEE